MVSCRHAQDVELCDECNQGSMWCWTCGSRTSTERCGTCGRSTEAA